MKTFLLLSLCVLSSFLNAQEQAASSAPPPSVPSAPVVVKRLQASESVAFIPLRIKENPVHIVPGGSGSYLTSEVVKEHLEAKKQAAETDTK